MSNRWRRQYEGLEGLMGKMWCASRYFVYTLEKTFFFHFLETRPKSSLSSTQREMPLILPQCASCEKVGDCKRADWFQNTVRMGMTFCASRSKAPAFLCKSTFITKVFIR